MFVVAGKAVKVDRATHCGVALEDVALHDPLDHWVLEKRIGCVTTLVLTIGRISKHMDVVETNAVGCHIEQLSQRQIWLIVTLYVNAIAEAMYGSAHGCRGDKAGGCRRGQLSKRQICLIVTKYVSARAETCQREMSRRIVEHSCRAAWLLNRTGEHSCRAAWRLKRTGEHSCRAAWLLNAKVGGAATWLCVSLRRLSLPSSLRRLCDKDC